MSVRRDFVEREGVVSHSHIPAMPAKVVNNLGMPGTLSVQPFVRGQIFVHARCFDVKVLHGSVCDFDFPVLRAEVLFFATTPGVEVRRHLENRVQECRG